MAFMKRAEQREKHEIEEQERLKELEEYMYSESSEVFLLPISTQNELLRTKTTRTKGVLKTYQNKYVPKFPSQKSVQYHR